MKMLDYVQLAHVRMGENLERSSELVAQLVDIFQSGSFDALRIVASGSSRHAADCARDYLQDALQMQVSVVTPEAFVDFEHTYPQHALNIAVSQSGYSTNTIAALDYMRAHDDVAADGTTHLAWGDGDRDMRADLDRLVARGYRGVVSAETYDGRYFADPAAADAQVMAEYRRAIGA